MTTEESGEPTSRSGIAPVDPSAAQRRVGAEADRAIEHFDQGIIDLLAWLLDTETRARIYVYLRKYPGGTSEEVARGTGLYPSTVRESLAALHEDGVVIREKRESEGAGNNPYEYEAIPPSSLVRGFAGQVQDQLNTLINLDRYLDGDPTPERDPIRIEVHDTDDPDDPDNPDNPYAAD